MSAGWGAPLGFSSGPSPLETLNTAVFGEPGWYCRFRHIPSDEYPYRARLRTPCASAVFNDVGHAAAFLEGGHSSDIEEMARRYTEWARGKIHGESNQSFEGNHAM